MGRRVKKYTRIDFDPFYSPEIPTDDGWYYFENKRERWRMLLFTKDNQQFMIQYGTEDIYEGEFEFFRCYRTKRPYNGASDWKYSAGPTILDKDDDEFDTFYRKSVTKLGSLW